MFKKPKEEPVPWWAWHRRLYNWVLSFAHYKYATASLFVLSVIESCILPVAPDVLMITMILERPKNTWYYAAITTIASVIGGMIGYLIGSVLWDFVSGFFFQYVFSEAIFNRVDALYHEYGFLAVFVAAFTPIPYKVFTIAAGVFQIPFVPFVLASLLGRSGRFFSVAALLWWFGPPVKLFIEKYFNLLTIILVILLVGGFFLIKYL